MKKKPNNCTTPYSSFLKYLVITLIICVLSIGSLFALGKDPEAKGGNSQEINVYSYRQKFLISGILQKFSAQTGITVNTIYIGKGLAERIKLEGKKSPADIILTTDIGQLIELEKADVIQPVNSSVINNTVRPNLRHPNNLWFGLTTRARIIYTSKDRVKPGEIKNYEDLTDNRWNNKVCIRSGYHTYNLALFASLIANNGLNATKQYLMDLKKNLARKPQGNDRAQVKAIKEGLCDVAIGNSYYYGKMLYNHKEPEQIEWAKSVNLVFPNQDNRGTHENISGMAMAKYSPNAKNAKILMEFLVDDLAQYIYSTENFEFPVNEKTPLSPFLQSFMTGVKWDDIDVSEIAKNRKQATILLDEIQFDQ